MGRNPQSMWYGAHPPIIINLKNVVPRDMGLNRQSLCGHAGKHTGKTTKLFKQSGGANTENTAIPGWQENGLAKRKTGKLCQTNIKTRHQRYVN